tara:strand:- start:209 stop:769 length:561 start_codon:yes stop_codon:yes gene_type:complete
MGWLSRTTLEKMGFRALGRDVMVSEKCSIYEPHNISIGDYSRIDDFCVISGTVTLGRNVHIAVQCNLAGGEPGITMDDFAGLAYGVQVFAQSDDYSGKHLTNPTVPDIYKVESKKPVHLSRHVIIGANSVIMPGVHIAEGCSVGALSLVNRSTEPWGIYVGAPARRVKERSDRLLALEDAYRKSDP